MSDKIPVTVIVTTYAPNEGRAAIAEQTIKSFAENLIYPDLRWIISDDGSPNHDEFMARLKVHVPTAETININRGGVGKSKNTALKKAFEASPIIFLSEDDWILTEKLDLLRHVQLLLDYEENSVIRFGYLGGTFTASYDGYGPFSNYWFLHQGSGVYIYSGQVSLRHQRLYSAVGWHREDCSPGEEEIDFCIRYNGTPNAGKILWPAEYGCILNAGPFKNIGMGNSLNGIAPT